ncbi:MAG TPA: CHASE3 domain-containing protein [Thermoleophilaceae bacterium]|nr:CHASE3 domain-containing protein [Thermoleophilaceae bacterium]
MGSAIPRLRRLDTRFYAAALVFAIALVAIRIGIVVTNRDLRDASELAEHSQQVLAASDAVQRLTVDLETGLRGWQLTNDRQFLAPTQQALRQLPGRLDDLERLVRDNPVQAARVRSLAAGVDSYIEDYVRPALTMDPSQLSLADRRATTEEGKSRLDSVRDDFDSIRRTESQLAVQRSQDARDSSARAETIGIVALVALLLLLAAAVVYLARAVVAPVGRTAQAARRIAGGDLTARVKPGGAGEVAQLGSTFNTMAEALESNRTALERGAQELRRTNAELDARAGELAEAYRDLEVSKEQSILALSTPALEIDAQTLLLPLIGEVSRERAQQIKQRLLDAVRERRSRFVVLDVTGVPSLDTDTARLLVEIIEAARLLGASLALTGVSGELAAALVNLGIDPHQLTTRADLRAGVAWATHAR